MRHAPVVSVGVGAAHGNVSGSTAAGPNLVLIESGPISSLQVRAILKARRKRENYFPDGLFADPAWDMLLELYAAALAGERMATSSLCIGAAVPATTALRWVAALADRDLLEREKDHRDGRRVFVSLSANGFAAMNAYFEDHADRLQSVL